MYERKNKVQGYLQVFLVLKGTLIDDNEQLALPRVTKINGEKNKIQKTTDEGNKEQKV